MVSSMSSNAAQFSQQAFDEFAELLTASILGDKASVNRVLLDGEVALSQVLLVGVVMAVDCLGTIGHFDDMTLEEVLPVYLAALRDQIVAS